MITGLEDFSLVNLTGYGGMIEDFVSYPANANAVSGMPYRSVEELDEFLYPELSVLDPAWLTESVREIEWFRVNGVSGGRVSKTPVRGPKPPPVVTKDFLEEARETIGKWSAAWESGPCVSGVVVDPDRLPTEWTPLGGGVTVTWDGEGWFEGIPDGGLPGTIPNSVDPAKELWRVLGRSAVRDFLSIRLFDRKKPFDNLETPAFSWTGLGGKGSPGVDRRLLAKQILAVHSDCEKATALLVPSPNVSTTQGERRTYSVLTVRTWQDTFNSRYKNHEDCSDGCGTVRTREAEAYGSSSDDEQIIEINVNSGFCPDPSMLLGPRVVGPSGFLPVRLSESRLEHVIDYGVDACHDAKCENTRYRAGDIWDSRRDDERTGRMAGVAKELEIGGATVPDWVEPRRVWLLVVARSRRLKCTAENGNYVVSEMTGTTDAYTVSKGSFKSQMYVCAIPASISDGTYIRVSGMPDVPAPSGSDFHHEVRMPAGGGSNGRQLFKRQTVKIDNDYAEVVGIVGLVVDAKFTASVKD